MELTKFKLRSAEIVNFYYSQCIAYRVCFESLIIIHYFGVKLFFRIAYGVCFESLIITHYFGVIYHDHHHEILAGVHACTRALVELQKEENQC